VNRRSMEGWMSDLQSAIEQLDIEELIRYGVEEEKSDAALAVYKRLSVHPVALVVLRRYYSELPEAREEMAVDLKQVASSRGASLLVLESSGHHYLYLHAGEEALFIGEFSEGITDQRLLEYFGYKSVKDFWRKTGKDPAALPSLVPESGSEAAPVCVACGVAAGEAHILGCPVELCPWCMAQLNRCNCRFDQLGVIDIDDEEQLDRFEELLDAKGRIVFEAGQNPSYPTAGNDPAPGKMREDK
jgi:hypothetical protein